MNEEIVNTLLQTIIITIFLTAFFTTLDNNVKTNLAYFSHAEALQTINEIINAGENFEEYCEFITEEKIRIRKGNETCQSSSINPFKEEKDVMIVSLPVLDDNEVVWVSSYA